MTRMDLYSEPYRPEGNIDARATRRALGQPPQFGPWALFLRETLQNSWDARLAGADHIHYRADAYWPDPEQLRALKTEVFDQMPPAAAWDGVRSNEDLPLLVVTDHGTRGLSGPTRADAVEEGQSDFVDFVRNVGRAEEKELGGGTYGFGKGVLYESSVCATVVLFTRTEVRGRRVSRLMAMRLGSSYVHSRRKYTGRHWWGVASAVTGAEPLTGLAAEGLARRLGMTFIPEDRTGTSLMVVGPVAHEPEETLEDIVRQLADAALWWAWPHIVGEGGGPSVIFGFSHEGEEVAVGDPSTHPVLQKYVEALRRAEAVAGTGQSTEGWPWTDRVLRSGHGQKTRLGALSYRRIPPLDRPVALGAREPEANCHVALMRAPRLVVKYLEAPADPSGNGLAGVFIAEPALDRDFALSEPVAHDDWVPSKLRLDKYQRNPVRQALEKLRQELRPPVIADDDPAAGTRHAGLVPLSSQLGALLDGLPGGLDARRRVVPHGRGGGVGRTAGDAGDGSGTGSRRVRVGARVQGEPELVLLDGVPAVRFPVELTATPAKALRVVAEPRVVVDGGVEQPDDAPIGAPVPEVLGWGDDDGIASEGPVVHVGAGRGRRLWVWVTQPTDVAVTVVLTAANDPT